MRRRLLCAGLLLSLLCSCAAPVVETQSPEPEPITVDTIAQAILRSQPDPEVYADRVEDTAPDGGELAFYLELYGVDWDLVCDAAVYTVGGVDAREVAVISLDHGTYGYDTSSTAAALEEYRQNRRGDFFGYSPDQAALVEKGGVVTAGSWVALLICEDMTAARTAFETATGETTDLPAEPTPYDWTKYVNEKGWKLFDPPNEFDMTPYDTSAILTAWETGDDSGLSEKDAAILTKCREIFGTYITEGMTDFQKEVALHDWLVDQGRYDQTVHDPQTPMGREDNANPYGMLVNGYGICLGYATTFQLFMDLAEVECITVVGASGASSGDHAWNMVHLEGEWYCVDPTWNDSTIPHPEAYTQEELSRRHHRYFNVTSQDLRDSDHQWDYENIPEATATRFRWDGTRELPQ